jgi:hypothetical protein
LPADQTAPDAIEGIEVVRQRRDVDQPGEENVGQLDEQPKFF